MLNGDECVKCVNSEMCNWFDSNYPVPFRPLCTILYSFLIPWHRKYSQSEYTKADVYSTVLHPTSNYAPCIDFLGHCLGQFWYIKIGIFSLAWNKLVMQRSLMVYQGISHLSLVFSWYTLSPKDSLVYRENTSAPCDIPWYTTGKRCITGT